MVMKTATPIKAETMLFRGICLLLVFSLLYVAVSEGTLEEAGPTYDQSQPQEESSGSGDRENNGVNSDHQLKGHIPKVDHSKGVYMHDHPDFPSVHGGRGGPYRTHYLHSRFGIGGHRKRRSTRLEEAMLKMFNIRLPKEEDGL